MGHSLYSQRTASQASGTNSSQRACARTLSVQNGRMTTETPERKAPLRSVVAGEIRAWLGRRDMTRAELERRLNRAHPYLSRRMSGDIAFDVDDLEGIASALGVSVTTLFRQDGDEATRRWPSDPQVATPVRRIPNDQRVIAKIDIGVNRPAHPTSRRAVRLRRDTSNNSHRPVTPGVR